MTVVESIKTYKLQFLFALSLLAAVYYSVVPDMVYQWYDDANYYHGFVVPLIAGYFVYERRRHLAEVAVDPWWPGVLVILLGLVQLLIGWLGMEFFTMRSSLVGHPGRHAPILLRQAAVLLHAPPLGLPVLHGPAPLPDL